MSRLKKAKTVDKSWFKNVFNNELPDKILKYLHSLETIYDYNQGTSIIEKSFADFGDEVKIMLKSDKKRGNKNIEYC